MLFKLRSQKILLLCTICSLTTIFCFLNTGKAVAADVLEELGATLIARFDKEIVIDKPKGMKIQRYGGKIVPDGVSGGALQLNKGEYLTLDVKTVLQSNEGTISFWARPHWGFYDNLNGNRRNS